MGVGGGRVSREELGGRGLAQRDSGCLWVLWEIWLEKKPGWGHMEGLKGVLEKMVSNL